MIILSMALAVLTLIFCVNQANGLLKLFFELKGHTDNCKHSLIQQIGEVEKLVQSQKIPVDIEAQLKARLDENILLAKEIAELKDRIGELSFSKEVSSFVEQATRRS